jgi:hypothetical protein
VQAAAVAALRLVPYAGVGVIVASVLYVLLPVRRDPGIGERVGSIVADE